MYARALDDGLMVIDGAFTNSVWTPEWPLNRALTLIVELIEDGEDHPEHGWVLEVLHLDGETIARIEGTLRIDRTSATVLTLPFLVSLRREGHYKVTFRVDGDEHVRLPLEAMRKLG